MPKLRLATDAPTLWLITNVFIDLTFLSGNFNAISFARLTYFHHSNNYAQLTTHNTYKTPTKTILIAHSSTLWRKKERSGQALPKFPYSDHLGRKLIWDWHYIKHDQAKTLTYRCWPSPWLIFSRHMTPARLTLTTTRRPLVMTRRRRSFWYAMRAAQSDLSARHAAKTLCHALTAGAMCVSIRVRAHFHAFPVGIRLVAATTCTNTGTRCTAGSQCISAANVVWLSGPAQLWKTTWIRAMSLMETERSLERLLFNGSLKACCTDSQHRSNGKRRDYRRVSNRNWREPHRLLFNWSQSTLHRLATCVQHKVKWVMQISDVSNENYESCLLFNWSRSTLLRLATCVQWKGK